MNVLTIKENMTKLTKIKPSDKDYAAEYAAGERYYLGTTFFRSKTEAREMFREWRKMSKPAKTVKTDKKIAHLVAGKGL